MMSRRGGDNAKIREARREVTDTNNGEALRGESGEARYGDNKI